MYLFLRQALHMSSRLALNLGSSCLYLLNAGNIEMHHWLTCVLTRECRGIFETQTHREGHVTTEAEVGAM
jgi:hypothetical protein